MQGQPPPHVAHPFTILLGPMDSDADVHLLDSDVDSQTSLSVGSSDADERCRCIRCASTRGRCCLFRDPATTHTIWERREMYIPSRELPVPYSTPVHLGGIDFRGAVLGPVLCILCHGTFSNPLYDWSVCGRCWEVFCNRLWAWLLGMLGGAPLPAGRVWSFLVRTSRNW